MSMCLSPVGVASRAAFAHTMNTAAAYMELDFGVNGVRSNRVAVINRGDGFHFRLYGCRLFVEDVDRNLIFTHRFSATDPMMMSFAIS